MKRTLVENVALIVNEDKNFHLIDSLKERWADEREYENFSDYEEHMKKAAILPKEAEFVKATKRPFGFVVAIGGVNVNIFWKAKSPKYAVLAAKRA